jgi:hypothetical protein
MSEALQANRELQQRLRQMLSGVDKVREVVFVRLKRHDWR